MLAVASVQYIVYSTILRRKLMNPLRTFLNFVLIATIVIFGNYQAVGAEDRPLLLPADCPTCCEKVNLYPEIPVDDLMKIKYLIKYTKFARDYNSKGIFYLIDRKGFTRTRGWERFRVIINRDGIDYKDLIVVTNPQNIKGLSVLTWMYLDPKRERDNWLWLPSQRKLRRISLADADDSALGSDWTVEEMSTRRWEDETYSFVNLNEKYEGFQARYSKEKHYEGVECWVVEAKPKRDPWYYSRRILHIPKNYGMQVFGEVYDPNGQRFKELPKVFEIINENCLVEKYLENFDLRSGHLSAVTTSDKKFNTGIDEKFISPKSLMRTKW